jgi:uncharacterized repeat protein (TIGR03987 family)
MNPILGKAVIIVTFALLFYSVGVIQEQRKSAISKQILSFLTAGIICDIASTTLMIIGSRNIPITLHGLLGYSALAAMLVDTILIWRHWISERGRIKVPHKLHLYTRIAYGWWVFAYIAGAIIAMVIGV